MHQPANSRACPVCRAEIDLGKKPGQKSSNHRGRGFKAKYLARYQRLTGDISEMAHRFFDTLQDSVARLTNKSIDRLDSRMITNPIKAQLDDAEAKNCVDELFSRKRFGKCTGSFSAGSLREEEERERVGVLRTEILRTALHLYTVRKKMNNTRLRSLMSEYFE